MKSCLKTHDNVESTSRRDDGSTISFSKKVYSVLKAPLNQLRLPHTSVWANVAMVSE